jgi:DNA-binding transcriptional MerR regulator
MTLREVADHFGITTKTVREWERLGKIPLRKNGRWAKAEILGR